VENKMEEKDVKKYKEEDLIPKEKIRKILERRLKETASGGERESIERHDELIRLREELLGERLVLNPITLELEWEKVKEVV